MNTPRNYDELPMNWVGDYSGRRANVLPHLVCVHDTQSKADFSYRQIDDRANRVATYMVDTLGLKKGDRVALISRNRLECIDLFFACAKTGVILCPLSHVLQKPELRDLLSREQPKVIFFEDILAGLLDQSVLPDPNPALVKFGADAGQYDQILATAPRDVKVPLAMNDPFLYIHTGGTTAVPKVCIVPHRQMLWNVIEYLMLMSNVNQAKEAVFFPFFHIGGWNTFFCLFMKGTTAIIMPQFDAGQVLDMINSKQIDHLGSVEAMLYILQIHPKFKETDFSGLRSITTGAAPCSEEILRPFWDKNISSHQAYGLTEAGPTNFTFVPQELGMDHIQAHANKIGTPFFCCDFKIVDRNDRSKTVARGDVGVLCLRSAHNFDGYLNDPARTEKLMDADGWIFSGDLAVEDAQGLVSIVGRADNMFISGGENVSPEEIEIALQKHPAVLVSICTGIPDKQWGQVPMAMAVLRPGAAVSDDELRTHCLGLLAKYKVPKGIELAPMIPVTSMGKPDRTALRKYFVEQASRQESAG
jgi:fatty-acyl-CoA synthase